MKPLLTDILYNGHLPAADNSNCTNSLCHSHNTKKPPCSGHLSVPANGHFWLHQTQVLPLNSGQNGRGPVLNQQDWAKNGWGHLKSGWGEEDSACAHAWQRSCKRRLWAFLPVIDDLPAFVLLISMVRSPPILLLPSSHSPPVPFLSYCPLPPALSKLTFSTLQFSPGPSHHSLTLMPLSPSLKALDRDPVTPSSHVSSI